MPRRLTEKQALAVLVILREECGYQCDERQAGSFVHAHVDDPHLCAEWRFGGSLGFGGKFRSVSYRTPYVDCYPEHFTQPGKAALIAKANARLAELFNSEAT